MARLEHARWFSAASLCALAVLIPDFAYAADGMRTGMIIAYASLGLAGLVGIAGGIWWSWDLKRNQTHIHNSPSGSNRQQPEKFVERTPLPTSNTGEFRVEPSTGTDPMQVVLRSVRNQAERECPKCSRTFPEGIIVCPIDATPLEPVRPRRRSEGGRGTSERPFCGACGRVYDNGTTYCYHDGQELRRDPRHVAMTFHVCKKCGWETDTPTERCPHDDEPLTKLDPNEQESVVPTIPMMTCRNCGHVAGPSETRCPNDGQMLYPLLNVRLHALPTTGVGPRRKVCTSCGESYSRAAKYCAHDGDKLTPLN